MPEENKALISAAPAKGAGVVVPLVTAPQPPDIPEWLRELYPFNTSRVEIGGHCMSLLQEGPADAPAVVLLHGSPAWSYAYRKIVPQLRTRFRVIAPDHIGFGLSDKPADPGYHTLEQHIANFTALVQALGLKKFTLVVNGWGGPIGLGYAVEHPETISRVVLTNTWGFPLPNLRTLRVPFWLRLAHSRAGTWLEPMLHLAVTTHLFYGTARTLPDLVVEGYKYPFGRERDQAVHALWRTFLHPSKEHTERLAAVEAGLRNIKAPAGILWGARDPLLTKLSAYLLRDALKNASEPVFLEDASYFVPEDAPEMLLRAIMDEKRRELKKTEATFNILH